MVDLLGYAAGVFLMMSFLPQIIKAARTRSLLDFSWGMLAATATSALFYELYALALGLTPVIFMNGTFFLSVLVVMVMKWRFEHQ